MKKNVCRQEVLIYQFKKYNISSINVFSCVCNAKKEKKPESTKIAEQIKAFFANLPKPYFSGAKACKKGAASSQSAAAAALVDSHVSWLQCIHLVYRCLGSLCFVSILYVVGRGGVARRHEVPRLLLCARQASKLRVFARSPSLLVHGCCCWLGFGCFGWCKQMACAPKNCCFQLPWIHDSDGSSWVVPSSVCIR